MGANLEMGTPTGWWILGKNDAGLDEGSSSREKRRELTCGIVRVTELGASLSLEN